MLEEFMKWEMLQQFPFFVAMVWAFVQATKEKWFLKNISTQDYANVVAFIMLMLLNLRFGTFLLWDIPMYLISSVLISSSASGIVDRVKK